MKLMTVILLVTQVQLTFADELSTKLKNVIKKHRFSEQSLGLFVEDEGKALFSLNADKLMVPASLTKIITGAAVLNSFPMNKKFETTLKARKEIQNGILKGDLCLKGGGDPSFVSEKMWYLVNELKRSGLVQVEGDLRVDASRFDDELFDSGRESVRVDRAFDAPVSAASFNWNSVNVFVRPGDVGKPARVFLDPENDYVELENKTKTVSKNGVKSIEASRVKVGDHDKIIVSGSLSADAPEVVIYKSISNPNLWIGLHLKEFLKQRGIALKGKVKIENCEADSAVLAVSPSKNLNEILSDMLKFSNNFVAEMLAKNLAAENSQGSPTPAPARMKDGLEEIKKYLDSIGFSRKDYVLENVSGLTRDNRFTAKQLAFVLSTIKNDFLIFPEFLSGLPIAGVDGTLKNRMKKGEQSLVRAKTGYLDGVVGLAGYIGRKNNSPLVFVFMYNGGYEQGLAARPLFDELINQLKQ